MYTTFFMEKFVFLLDSLVVFTVNFNIVITNRLKPNKENKIKMLEDRV